VRAATLLSCPEDGVLFVQPDVTLDPPLRMVVRGVNLAGQTLQAELTAEGGERLAVAEATAAHDDHCVVSVERLPASVFVERAVRVFARASLGAARVERPSPLTLVRADIDKIVTTGTTVSQYGYDVCVLLFGLGTREVPPLNAACRRSIKRTAAEQLGILQRFAAKLETKGKESFAGHPVAAMTLGDVDSWMPVYLKVKKHYAIAVPREVTWPPVERDGLMPKTYHASLHIAGLAVDTARTPVGAADSPERDLIRLYERVDEIAAYHAAPVYVRYEGMPTEAMKKKGITETENQCVHVEYRRPRPPAAAKAAGAKKKPTAKGAPAGKYPALAAGAGMYRLPEKPTRRTIEVGTKGSERMVVEVAKATPLPCDSPRGEHRKFRVIVYVHGIFKPARPPAYRNAHSLWYEKKVDDHIRRMTAAGQNVVVAMLEDAKNMSPGWQWVNWKDPAMLLEALDKAEAFAREIQPGAELEGVSLLCHSGGGRPLLTGWLRSAAVRARLSADDGEVVLLDCAYWDAAPGGTFVADGGRATFVWRRDMTTTKRDKKTHAVILGDDGKPKIFPEAVRAQCERLRGATHAADVGPYRPIGGPPMDHWRTPDGRGVFLGVLNRDYDHTRIGWDWETFLPHLFKVGETLYGTPLLDSVTPLDHDLELECGARSEEDDDEGAEEALAASAGEATEHPLGEVDLEEADEAAGRDAVA